VVGPNFAKELPVLAFVTLCNRETLFQFIMFGMCKIKTSYYGQVSQRDMRIFTALSSGFPILLLEVALYKPINMCIKEMF